MIATRDTRSAWLLVAAGMIAAVTLVLVEDLGSNQLYALTLHFPGVDKVLHFIQSFIVFTSWHVAWPHRRAGEHARMIAAVGDCSRD